MPGEGVLVDYGLQKCVFLIEQIDSGLGVVDSKEILDETSGSQVCRF